MTAKELKAARKANLARMRQEFSDSLGGYYAQSAATSVIEAFRRGDFVEIKA